VLADGGPVTVVETSSLVPGHDRYLLQVRADGAAVPVLEIVLGERAVPNRLVLVDDQLEVTCTVRDWQHFRRLADRVEDATGTFELAGVTEVDDPGYPLGGGTLSRVLRGKMTDRQLDLLRTAHESGLFDVPQRATEEDLAAELGISQSTVSERLHRAENRLLEVVFGG
jgi:hypothetical protein